MPIRLEPSARRASLALAVLVPLALAAPRAEAQVEPALGSGAVALQFRVLGGPLAPMPEPPSERPVFFRSLFGGLEAFAGGASGLVHLTDRLALRAGFDFAGVEYDGPVRDECSGWLCPTRHFQTIDFFTFADLADAVEAEHEGYTVLWESPVLFYPRGDRAVRVQPYVGVGPTHANDYLTSTLLLPEGYADAPIRDIARIERAATARTTRTGGVLVLGGAWFVTRRIALSGEYGFGVVRTSSRTTGRETLRRASDGALTHLRDTHRARGWQARSEPVRLGLTLYL